VNLEPCAHCGVTACEARFHALLVRDFTDSGYGAVHHLVVSSYMLQHDLYDLQTRVVMLAFVSRTLESFPTTHDLATIRAVFSSSRRAIKRDRQPPDQPRAWTLTVADVDDSSAETYQRTVRDWARSVLETFGVS
jgi:hypothetical protein